MSSSARISEGAAVSNGQAIRWERSFFHALSVERVEFSSLKVVTCTFALTDTYNLTPGPLCFSCKEYKNLNSFFAIIMGLSNVAVSRLSLTWEVSLS